MSSWRRGWRWRISVWGLLLPRQPTSLEHLAVDLDLDDFFADATGGPRRMPVLEARPIAMAGPVESQASISIADAEICRVRDRAHVGESAGFPPEQGVFQICSEATSGWTRRYMVYCFREINCNVVMLG